MECNEENVRMIEGKYSYKEILYQFIKGKSHLLQVRGLK
ncbi:Protein of unknown function [Bacillus wiedmannii]|nr:Protein of unknown function [Bacillus wiedmannii]